MRKLVPILAILFLHGCVAKQIVRPRELVGHAITNDTVVLLSRTWLQDGSLQYAMEISFFSAEVIPVNAGQNLDLFIDGHRYRLASRHGSVQRAVTEPATAPRLSPEYLNYYEQSSTHQKQVQTLVYDGLPPEFIARLGHATSVNGSINGTNASWGFKFTQVLLRQFYDWAE